MVDGKLRTTHHQNRMTSIGTSFPLEFVSIAGRDRTHHVLALCGPYHLQSRRRCVRGGTSRVVRESNPPPYFYGCTKPAQISFSYTPKDERVEALSCSVRIIRHEPKGSGRMRRLLRRKPLGSISHLLPCRGWCPTWR